MQDGKPWVISLTSVINFLLSKLATLQLCSDFDSHYVFDFQIVTIFIMKIFLSPKFFQKLVLAWQEEQICFIL